MTFEYDRAKSRKNLAKHGIDFIEAQKLWQGAMVVFPSRQPGERRELAIGMLEGVFWTAVVTARGVGGIRLISVRRSRKEEIDAYHQAMKGEEDENEQKKSDSKV